jgi:hypothetical protein
VDKLIQGAKLNKGKLIGGSSGVAVIIFFFWNLGVSTEDLRAIPDNRRQITVLSQRMNSYERREDEALLSLKEMKTDYKELSTQVVRATTLLESQDDLIKEMRQDIKELLKR